MSSKQDRALVPGDQIIATDVCYFDYSEEVKRKRLYSQQPGDILMVNNLGDEIVGGFSLNGVAYNGRKRLGLAGSLRVGKFRLATPDDPGYMATREQWHDMERALITSLRSKLVLWRVLFMTSTVMALWVLGAQLQPH